MNASTIVQITDTHLLTDPRRRLYGWRVAAGAVALGRWRLLTTPSTWRQFLPGSVGHAEDPRRAPGYRVLRCTRTAALPAASSGCRGPGLPCMTLEEIALSD